VRRQMLFHCGWHVRSRLAPVAVVGLVRRILVVEDSVSARAFVRAVLESPEFAARHGGCDVIEASSGFEALRLLPRGPYDLIVTDINMADINGLELVRFIRASKHHRSTPLLIISSLRGELDVERGLALGANAYLPKPFSPEQLRDVCNRLIGAGPARMRRSDPPPGGP
jgi:two-component system, chemotaxis family, chemotaxis protein CheY